MSVCWWAIILIIILFDYYLYILYDTIKKRNLNGIHYHSSGTPNPHPKMGRTDKKVTYMNLRSMGWSSILSRSADNPLIA